MKSSSDARKVASMKCQYDFVICSEHNVEDIPDHSFTLVLVEGNAFLNDSKLRYTFEDNCKSVDEVLL